MDIEALLAASNLEAAAEDSGYNTDEFEDEGTDQSDNKDEKAGLGEDKMAILKAAAAKVAVEEKRNADRVFNDTADNIREDFKAKKQSERSAEDILADASKAVNEHYNKQGAPDAEKFRTIEEEKEKEKESDEEMDEGEDDEEEGDTNEDPQLNRTLLFACFNEKVELLKSTLRKGAYYFTRDRHGWTALHWAASKGNEDLTEALLSHVKGTGRNLSRFVNAQDKISGWTPMHIACVNGSIDVIEVLLKYKARKNKLNFFKEKPVDCVGKVKRTAIRKLLGVVVPVRNDAPLAMESEAFGTNDAEHKHSEDRQDHRQVQDRQDYVRENRQPAPPHGGIPTGRRPPTINNTNMCSGIPSGVRGGAHNYETSSDSTSSRSSSAQYGHREEKSYR